MRVLWIALMPLLAGLSAVGTAAAKPAPGAEFAKPPADTQGTPAKNKGEAFGLHGADAPKPLDAGQRPPTVVMLRIEGSDVTVAQYAAYLQANPAYIKQQREPEGKAKAIRAMVSDLLLRRQIAKEHLAEGDSPEQMLAGFQKLADKHFPLPPAADGEVVKQYYLEHLDLFGIPPMVRVSQIQIRFSKGAPQESLVGARHLAEEALRRVESGEDFAKVAGETTQNGDARGAGGDLGYLPRGDLDWLDAALTGLHIGEHTQILETPAGYEILKLTGERPGLPSPFEQVKERVISSMQTEAQDKAREAYVAELAGQTKIEVVSEQIKPLFPNGVFSTQ